MIRRRLGLTALALIAGLLAAPPTPAQSEPDPDAGLTKQERKQRAKEERIREYLRKKEERRLLREQRRADARSAAERSVAEAATATTVATATPRPTKKKTPKPARAGSERTRSALPRHLAQAQANVRSSALGDDETVQSYLELIERQGASPYQLAAFGNFIAQSGLTVDALAYYDVALRIERDDPTLWINMGTLQRQQGDNGGATNSFNRALRLDPNSAVAHYNLGAIFDDTGRYEEAIEAFKTALTLDPALGDPATNPQAANNERLLAVKLMLYQEQTGSLGLPLQPIDPNRNGDEMR